MLIGNYFQKINYKYKKHFFSGLSFNSLECKKDNIFFAIKGNKVDGNQFIDEAIKRGAKTIISNNKFTGFKKRILFLNSKNVRKSLSEIAYKICENKPKNLIFFNFPMIKTNSRKKSVMIFFFYLLEVIA